jgi:hypothetical protein
VHFALRLGRVVVDATEVQLKGFRERRVASLFCEVIGVPVERADDDFFVLGGDDRSAAALLEVIAEDAGVRLASDAVVRHPTVRELAHEVATTRPMQRGRVIVFGRTRPVGRCSA